MQLISKQITHPYICSGLGYLAWQLSRAMLFQWGLANRKCPVRILSATTSSVWRTLYPGGGYSSSSRAGRLGRTLWPQNSTSVAETEKWGQNSTMTPPTLEKGGQYSTSVGKVCKKGGQKYTILKNIGVKILQVWKWGSKFYMLKNRSQNSTMLEKRGVNILHPTPKVEVKILHRLKKGGQKGRAYPLPKI